MTHPLDQHQAAYRPDFPYYEENRLSHAAYGERLVRTIAELGARKVLSLGVGHSEVASRILACLRAGQIEGYTVVEGSPAILQAFATRVTPLPSGLELIEGWFETFTHPGRFDLIEAGFVLEHVEDPAFLLERLHGFLAPHGRLIVAVPNARSLHRLLGHLAGLLPDMYALSEADRLLGHRRYFDQARLLSLLETCGYRVLRVEGILLKPFTTAQLTRLDLPAPVWDALVKVATDYPDIAHAICVEVSG